MDNGARKKKRRASFKGRRKKDKDDEHQGILAAPNSNFNATKIDQQQPSATKNRVATTQQPVDE